MAAGGNGLPGEGAARLAAMQQKPGSDFATTRLQLSEAALAKDQT